MFFLLAETGDHFLLVFINDAVNGFVAGVTLGQNVNSFTPAVNGVWPELDEAFLFKTAEQPRNRGMGQLKGFLNISGTGGCFPVGKKTHNLPLRRSQIHLGQGTGNRLVKLPVENAKLVSVVA